MNIRRKIVGALGAGVFAPIASFAQQPPKIWRVGVLGVADAVGYAAHIEALRTGLRKLGYVDGQNLALEFRWAAGDFKVLPDLVAQLVRLNVDVIVTHGPGTAAAKGGTTSIPIVAYAGDLVALGLVASLARPGGNITGVSFFGPELSAKRLELLQEAVPRIRQIAALYNPNSVSYRANYFAMQKVADFKKLSLRAYEIRTPGELDGVFAAMAKNNTDAVVVFDDPVLIASQKTVAELANQRRFPAAGNFGFADNGGLMTSGIDLVELWHRLAYFVDKILKGVKPASIPIEQPTKFELVVNMKTAKALGLKIPGAILLQATTVIE